MIANVQRAIASGRMSGGGRLKPGAVPVLLAAIGALLVTLLLTSLYMRARTAAPAVQRQEQRSSVEAPVPAAKAQKPSPLRLMEGRSARASRSRQHVRPTLTDDARSATGSNASDASVVGTQ